jgi:hypothetical protein
MANKTLKSTQEIQNLSFDDTYNVSQVSSLGFDGQNLQGMVADALATKVTTVGTITYVGIAAPGTAQNVAKWQCKKIDETETGTTVITWADGNALFDNAATDLTSLSYS